MGEDKLLPRPPGQTGSVELPARALERVLLSVLLAVDGSRGEPLEGRSS